MVVATSVHETVRKQSVSFHPTFLLLLLFLSIGFAIPSRSSAADMSQARALFYSGDYDACIEYTKEQVDRGIWNEFWSRMLVKVYLETGKYQEAIEVYEQVKTKFSNSIPLRIAAAEAYRFTGNADTGNRLLNEIPDLVNSAPWRYSDRDNLIAIGRYLLHQGFDAREILETFFDRAVKNNAKYPDAHLAIAELAIEKADYQEADKSLKKALELQPDDPNIRFLLAKTWAPSDSTLAAEYLEEALKLNPRHIDSLLFQARQLIDAEQYTASEEILDIVFDINAAEPRAWALKAAIAHLRGEYSKQGEYRTKALKGWTLNPEVDYLTGLVLSKHYRFEEGVTHQRRALRMDPRYLPSRFQLAQDLLRVGQEEEGWKIVDEVSTQDKYNVVAFNLRTLKDRLSQFKTLEAPGLIVRMDAKEADIYGDRVLRLLTEAKEVLAPKYEHELTRPVSVEIFPQQSDFAIRTFGLPGGAGFLGVCFGSLITANSPASQGDSPSNWESVLWHEFCHVITLQKTKNRMPRWLSEGISVYEELERDATWGEHMSPMYKSMILGTDFVPLSKLSSAFLNPKSPIHLQFAYFESSLAIRYLIDEHGKDRLLRLLTDLGIGVTIEEAFQRRYGDTEKLDADFEKFVKAKAEAFFPEADFSREGLPERPSPADLEQWRKDHPNSYFAQRQKTMMLVQSKDWDTALAEAKKLESIYPEDSAPGGALDLVAQISGALGDKATELEYLKKINALSSDNVPVLIKLISDARKKEDWEALEEYSSKLLAVQPLLASGHEGLIQASVETEKLDGAIGSLNALQQMEPLDPAGLRYDLANALYKVEQYAAARREVLYALEYAPRYREAQLLLVRINEALHPQSNIQFLDVNSPDEGNPPRPSQQPQERAVTGE